RDRRHWRCLPHRRRGVKLAAMPLDPSRTVAELRELRELTGDENGAQRVAWTDTWERARRWLAGKLDGTGAREEIDEAGNQWFTLPGRDDHALLIGGHIDSVPNGGWLDGALNVMAGVEVLRRIAEEGAAPYPGLHMEQGPVPESMDLRLGVVLGTFGVERSRITWTCQAAHAGSTPMDQRRDALAGAAKLALAIRDIARETGDGAVCT